MLVAVSIVCLVAVAGCLALAGAAERDVRPRRSNPAQVLLVALLFALVAAAAAAIDEKVSREKATVGAVTQAPQAPQAPQTTALLYALAAPDLQDFAGNVTVGYRPRKRPLCLVNYFDDGKQLGAGRSYKFWTGCADSDALVNVDSLRQALALPTAWGPRDARVIACVPRGATVPFLRSRAAPQWSEVDKRLYVGGGIQYRVLSFDTNWIVKREKVPQTPAMLPHVGHPCA